MFPIDLNDPIYYSYIILNIVIQLKSLTIAFIMEHFIHVPPF